MAGAQTPVSGFPTTAVLASSDLIGFVSGSTTKKITAGNFRSQLFGIAQADPLSIGSLTAVGNSTITGTLSGITMLTATSLTLAGPISGATTIAGTLTTAAQPNITSLGTLTTLAVSGSIDLGVAHHRPGTSTSVTTGPTTIFAAAGAAVSGMIVVNGHNAGADFVDIILYSGNSAAAPVVVVSGSVGGAPAARTYSTSGLNIQLAIAGTWTVKIAPLEMS